VFAELKALVFGKPAERQKAQKRTVDALQLAQAALLFHVIAADGVVYEAEKARLARILEEKFNLGADAAQELIEQARQADADAVDLYAFTRVLKRELPPEAKFAIVRDLWEMVYADGQLHEFEDNIVWRVAELLEVSARDRMELKRMVRETTGVPEA
jgi:uncharacterized tellurite resistance protein B-like protein